MKNMLFGSLMIVLGALPAFAGGESSGGAFALVCRTPSGAIQRSYLLDLYEGATVYGYPPLMEAGSLEDEWKRLQNKLVDARQLGVRVDRPWATVWMEVQRWMRAFVFVPNQANMPKTADLGRVPVLPSGCALEQAAYFDDLTMRVTINREVFESFTPLNQAALLYHESVYRQNRTVGERTSENVRKTVAALFSRKVFTPLRQLLAPGAIKCTGRLINPTTPPSVLGENESEFYITADPQDPSLTRFVFMRLFGRYSETPMFATVGLREVRRFLTPVRQTGYGDPVLAVTDPNARGAHYGALENGSYEGFSLQVVYQTGNVFSLGLLDRARRLQASMVVPYCVDVATHRPIF